MVDTVAGGARTREREKHRTELTEGGLEERLLVDPRGWRGKGVFPDVAPHSGKLV
jgi:hypothetical protein